MDLDDRRTLIIAAVLIAILVVLGVAINAAVASP
jgi:hypothetical protein